MLGKKVNELRRRSRSGSLGRGRKNNAEDPTIDTRQSLRQAHPPIPSVVSTSSLIPKDETTTPVKAKSISSMNSSQYQTAPAKSPTASSASNTKSTTNLTGEQVHKDEKRKKKIYQRVILGLCMFLPFCGILYAGHMYICLLVAVIETTLFYELVRVRYRDNFSTIEDKIPLFRTTQWMWFAVAMFFNQGDFVTDLVENNRELHHFLPIVQYTGSVSFVLYSTTLMITISTLQREHIRFQINQLCWTIMVLCLTMGQLKYVMHNIFNGLFWFVLPCCLVIINDIFAYICGMSMGRKFISRPFLSFSPNKTWEGFIGGGWFTLVAAWYLSGFLANFTWMTCPAHDFQIIPEPLNCTPDPIFMPAHWIFPSQVFELLPRNIARTLPGLVEICSKAASLEELEHVTSGGDPFGASFELAPCVSGYDAQIHSHFELTLTVYPIQIHGIWLGLFASVVAPCGGFLASAIKRAYGIKDFASFIPGHGGMMDRMDCQFLMALCTWVHYNTFVKLATVSVPKLAYLFSLLSQKEQEEFLELIAVE